jgi:hypothetical protein
MRLLKLTAAALTLPALVASCGDSGSSVDGAATVDGAALDLAAPARSDAGAVDAAADLAPVGDGASPGGPCSAADPDRLFWNDFEDGRYYAGAGVTYDPSRDFLVDDPTRFAVVDGTVMAAHDGQRSLRGNFWEWIGSDRTMPVHDPLAAKAGITILGAKEIPWHVNLAKLGISQTPPGDPNAPAPPPGEFYVSYWLWYDADFSHVGLNADGTTQVQTVKLFYAFGPNGVEWVVTDGVRLFMNENNLGAWPLLPWIGPPKLEGQWRHVEWYFKSESTPIFYEYGPFSNGKYMASGCNPPPPDYTVAFPVPGSNPVTCTDEKAAYAANSQDGVFRMKIDGQEFYPAQKSVAWNGRFDQIAFPAFHGGGGQPIASAGWAIDDVCIRKSAPTGF